MLRGMRLFHGNLQDAFPVHLAIHDTQLASCFPRVPIERPAPSYHILELISFVGFPGDRQERRPAGPESPASRGVNASGRL